MTDEHLPDLPDEDALALGEIDLAIAEVLASLDEHLKDLDPIDRTLVIHHVRWAYIEGYTALHPSA